MDTNLYAVKIRTLAPLLGTCPKQERIYAEYVASKAATVEEGEAEIADLDKIEDRGWTTFLKDKDGYYIKSYMLLGYLSEAARRINHWGVLKNLRDKVKGYVSVRAKDGSHKIRLPDIAAEPIERSIRCQTAQGQRVALIRSDYIEEGTELEFQVLVAEQSGITENCLREILEYGANYHGIGQWRSSGEFGTFSLISLEEVAPRKLSKKKSSK